jgi:hypothetical protein
VPTLNWLFETVEDRSYERGGEEVVRPPRTHACPLCDALVPELIELSWHLNEIHPLDRPVLLLRGAAARRHSVIRRSLDPGDIELVNTTHVRVHENGRHVQSIVWDDVPRMIAGSRRGVYRLKLENQEPRGSAGAEYELRLAIADEAELDAADEMFRQHLAVDLPTSVGIRCFKEQSEELSTAGRYVDGLIEFVLGVLAKDDRTAAHTPPDDVLRRFKRAVAELAEYDDRPVACAVSTVCRFNLNDVRQITRRTGDPLMDGCVELMRLTAMGGEWNNVTAPPPAASRNPLCPIDVDTYRVLSAFEGLFAAGAHECEVASFASLAASAELGSLDRVKLYVIIAAALAKAGRTEESLGYVRTLRHDPIFGEWAARLIAAGVLS